LADSQLNMIAGGASLRPVSIPKPRILSLAEIAAQVDGRVQNVANPDQITVSSISISSRTIEPEGIFVAIAGVNSDGHAFIDDAFARGASAAVVSDPARLKGRPGVLVASPRKAASKLAALFFGTQPDQLATIGVTGTNGKTTTVWLIYHLLNRLGSHSLRMGTLGIASELGISLPGDLTTPDPVTIHQCLAQARSLGVKSCVMEASSHALDQNRVDDVPYNVGVFTNLTRDHLDYHKTMEAYYLAKRHLFELIASSKCANPSAVINIDDEYGRRLAAEFKGRLHIYSFGRDKSAWLQIRSFEQSSQEMSVSLLIENITATLKIPWIGFYNAQNYCAALATAVALSYPLEDICEALYGLAPVPGRLEPAGNKDIAVYVDYAHTPDALERALTALREVTKGRLWAVFGCGGDRDKGKRPQMGEIAGRLADNVVVTSDNPRTEDPTDIINDILASGIKPRLVDPDRRSAIKSAISQASPGDVVLIAGKGHEDYQIVGTDKSHFSDVEEVKKALR
jgi:UDP-N-acetylmuramoyl-L-alanyl-D-glutamate--2,6-diaminopimelate ligase